MNKIVAMLSVFVALNTYSAFVLADHRGDYEDDEGYRYSQPQYDTYQQGNRYSQPRYDSYQQDNRYYQQPQSQPYYPQRQANYGYRQPQQNYYPPQHQNRGNDQRSRQGLLGGVIGTLIGYELGNGEPIAAGLGAAAGAFLGNGYY